MMTRLQKIRAEFRPKLPMILQDLKKVSFFKGEGTESIDNQAEIKAQFPHTFGRPIFECRTGKGGRKGGGLRVGVVFSGGQAAGGHNVITGLFDALIHLSVDSRLFGFLGGPSGIIDHKVKELTAEMIAPYRNQGGFDLIGSGRTKIETTSQLAASLKTVTELHLDGLVIIGGDDSNTNGALLAEYFESNGCKTRVVGVPKTIDGDLKNGHVATSFGFDTAAKTYSEMIGNISRDALSAKKYYHFIKLMGRSASHIALECALATHPNMALIGEEIAHEGKTLAHITAQIADMVEKRGAKGKGYGVILIPEGLIEFIPEVKVLIAELNMLEGGTGGFDSEKVGAMLSADARSCFAVLPKEIQKQLLFDRDPHGNVQVSLIATEQLLIDAVKVELNRRRFTGKFSALPHFLGYEGRAGFPSSFDTHYCYALGHTAALLIDEKLNGYMTCVTNLHCPVAEWQISALPLTMLMNMEMRKGKRKPVIQKALVDLEGKAFTFFKEMRCQWIEEDQYRYPGPIQFFGESELVDSVPITLQLEYSV